MIKYCNYDIVYQEIPNKISLAVNITNCPIKCKGCHSDYLASDFGDELTENAIDSLIDDNYGINCFLFMGGDNDTHSLGLLSEYIYKTYGYLNIAWYSGRDTLSEVPVTDYVHMDYIKLGHYDELLGPLNSKSTNQRLYDMRNLGQSPVILPGTKINGMDITNKFLK